jgi:hypothetical protein
MSELGKDKADELSKIHKIIQEDVIWRADYSGYKLRIRVLAPDLHEVLELTGIVGKTNRSFTLLFNRLPIRRYCNQGRHTGPDGVTVIGHHKHTWDQIHEDGFAYVPNDIDPKADPNSQFFQFLTEQNIDLKATYQHILVGQT